MMLDQKGHLKLTDFGLSEFKRKIAEKVALTVDVQKDKNGNDLHGEKEPGSISYDKKKSISEKLTMGIPSSIIEIEDDVYSIKEDTNILPTYLKLDIKGNSERKVILASSVSHKSILIPKFDSRNSSRNIDSPQNALGPNNNTAVFMPLSGLDQSPFSSLGKSNSHNPVPENITSTDKENMVEEKEIISKKKTCSDNTRNASSENRLTLTMRAKNANKNRIIGTPDYIAPKIVNGESIDNYGIDWWAVGCILYEFLCGIAPFNAATVDEIFDNVTNLRIEWPDIG